MTNLLNEGVGNTFATVDWVGAPKSGPRPGFVVRCRNSQRSAELKELIRPAA